MQSGFGSGFTTGFDSGGVRGQGSAAGYGFPMQAMSFWYKADTGALDASDAPISVDATAIKTWKDQSGTARDAVQATVANQPLWYGNQINGYPAVRFDGVNDFLAATGENASIRSGVMVVKILSLPGLIVGSSTAEVGVYCGPTYYGNANANYSTAAVTTNVWVVVGWRRGSTGMTQDYIYLNNVPYAPVTSYGSSSSTLYMGAKAAGAFPLSMWMAEMIVWSQAVAEANIYATSMSLMQKYGIS